MSCVASGRLEGVADSVFPAIAPDLAVEVLSPNDVARKVLDKVGEYLEAGVKLVWVIDPKSRSAAVDRSPSDVRGIAESGTLEGQNVIPGFSCRLAEIPD